MMADKEEMMADKEVMMANKETVKECEKTQPSTLTIGSLWPGCLFDSHCHLNLVHRYEITNLTS